MLIFLLLKKREYFSYRTLTLESMTGLQRVGLSVCRKEMLKYFHPHLVYSFKSCSLFTFWKLVLRHATILRHNADLLAWFLLSLTTRHTSGKAVRFPSWSSLGALIRNSYINISCMCISLSIVSFASCALISVAK